MEITSTDTTTSSGGIGGILDKQLTIKNILLIGAVGFGVYYFWNKNKDSAYQRAMLSLQKNPPPKIGGTGEVVRAIREKLDAYISQREPSWDDDAVYNKVMELTT